jgi:hypothetical protein
MAPFPTLNPFYRMDDLSAALAIQLLLEDSEELSNTSRGNVRKGNFQIQNWPWRSIKRIWNKLRGPLLTAV